MKQVIRKRRNGIVESSRQGQPPRYRQALAGTA